MCQNTGKLQDFILKSEKSVAILGAGINIADVRSEAIEFIEKLNIPTVLTYGGTDILPYNHPLYAGVVGIAGTYAANTAVQNSDLIIAMGTRLSPNVTGGKQNLFAPQAKKVMIDIDKEELTKFTSKEFLLDLAIHCDLKDFFKIKLKGKDNGKWLEIIKLWKDKYLICPSSYYESKKINPYVFVKELSLLSQSGDVITSDTGANLAWTMQAWETKKDQKIISAWNHTPMGYSLPAAIGASFTTKENVICLIGDGGLMMCLQELATVVRHKLPIKIFVFNNHGHSIQKQTIENWLQGNYQAVNEETGLSFPNFNIIATAFGIKHITLKSHEDIKIKLSYILKSKFPILVNVEIDPDARIVPMIKFGQSLDE